MSKLPHLRLEGTAESVKYTSTNTGGGKKFKTPVWSPSKHASDLKAGLEAARDEAKHQRERERTTFGDLLQRQPGGVVLTFESEEGHGLKLKSLEKLSAGIQLRNVTEHDGVEKATVFVPDGQLPHFFNLIDTYLKRTVLSVDATDENAPLLKSVADKNRKVSVTVKPRPEGKVTATITCPVSEVDRITVAIGDSCRVTKNVRKNTPLIDSIARVRLAWVEDFWGSATPFPKSADAIWWEVWLEGGRDTALGVVGRFKQLAGALGFRTSDRHISFPERVVLLAYGSAERFSHSLELLSMLAELREVNELATPYLDLNPREQQAFVEDLLVKVVSAREDAPAVCILDGGVNRGHVLLEAALAVGDAQSVNDAWGTADNDRQQHGTGMAGLALFGCLATALRHTKELRLRHRLESVKILPPPPRENDPDVYGALTQQAAALAMAQNPKRNRVHCMAVTEKLVDNGLPSSWSGAVDELCAGVLDETPKLMVLSAGNVREHFFSPDYRYHEWNITQAGVESPAQAWNALTVGAYTEKVVIQDPTYKEYEPIATSGDLCPRSRTSLAWPDDNHSGWPIKPDVVCEGGNYGMNANSRTEVEDLSLLTTFLHESGRLLEVTHGTSPATALAAKTAAELWSHYPRLRPETVRALLVHSAQWTPAMAGRFGAKTKGDVHRRLRCYGYGVPDLDRAAYSLRNATTLLFEGELQPFKFDTEKKKAVTNEMHLHALPWPKRLLEDLGETPISMRVTLSYYIEPSPGNVGWGVNHRYASHGLRFDVIRPLEDLAAFKKRISRAEWDNPKDSKSRPASQKDTRNWVVGDGGRTHGSLHSDWWEGTAAELAACGLVSVYPVTGWWRERAHLGRVGSIAKYSLLISLATPNTDVDLYTPIETAAKVVTEVLV